MIGVSVDPSWPVARSFSDNAVPADVDLMKRAGIAWVRHHFPFPFLDKTGGNIAPEYQLAKEEAQKWKERGMNILGATPYPGMGKNEPDGHGNLSLVWHNESPAWFGSPGSPEYAHNYQETCLFLAKDLKGLIPAWQVCNELDIKLFAGDMNLRQVCDLVIAGARGMKDEDASLLVGTNSVYFNRSYYLYGRLYSGLNQCFDYCGVDQYLGSWCPGAPESWDECILELSEITGTKILINEWGYASRGELMTEKERALTIAGTPACQFRKWLYGWRNGHDKDTQAEYVSEVFKVLKRHREKLMGAFFYRWEDQERCWQCGRTDCPLENSWGLVDANQKPKPSYYAFKNGVKFLRS